MRRPHSPYGRRENNRPPRPSQGNPNAGRPSIPALPRQGGTPGADTSMAMANGMWAKNLRNVRRGIASRISPGCKRSPWREPHRERRPQHVYGQSRIRRYHIDPFGAPAETGTLETSRPGAAVQKNRLSLIERVDHRPHGQIVFQEGRDTSLFLGHRAPPPGRQNPGRVPAPATGTARPGQSGH